jgi:hypothetical protein
MSQYKSTTGFMTKYFFHKILIRAFHTVSPRSNSVQELKEVTLIMCMYGFSLITCEENLGVEEFICTYRTYTNTGHILMDGRGKMIVHKHLIRITHKSEMSKTTHNHTNSTSHLADLSYICYSN